MNRRFKPSRRYLDLAGSWSTPVNPAMIVMHGLSGSGKSTVAEHLASSLGAIQIRSDIERKRLFKVDNDSVSAIDKGIYSKTASEQTYRHLAVLAENIINNGFSVIIDSACLRSWQRNLFKQLSSKLNVPNFLIHCQASESELIKRIEQRLKQGKDPSEANREVLLSQIENQDALNQEELDSSQTFICDQPRLSDKQIEKISALCAKNAL